MKEMAWKCSIANLYTTTFLLHVFSPWDSSHGFIRLGSRGRHYLNQEWFCYKTPHKKKARTCMRGPNFKIWLLYGDIIDTSVCGIFSSTLIPHFPPETINWPRLTPIMRDGTDSKLQMKKLSLGDNYRATLPHTPQLSNSRWIDLALCSNQ